MAVGSAVGATMSVAVGTGVAVGVGRTDVAAAAGPQAKVAIRNARSATVEIAGRQLIIPEFYQYPAVPTPCTVYRSGTR